VNTDERNLQIERLRESHHPGAIQTLFVGESRPANGKFFYDSELRPIARWFEDALELPGDGHFSHALQKREAVSGRLGSDADQSQWKGRSRPASPRGRACLRERIARYAPILVVAIMNGIAPFVREAAEGIARVEVVPFPGNGHQRKFVSEMRKLRSAILGHAPN
jgi:hypothetical protein